MARLLFVLICSFCLLECHHKAETWGEKTFFTCSMDPQVREKQPGTCPICKMDLTQVTLQDVAPTGLKLSPQQLETAAIQTEKVALSWISQEKLLYATVALNQNLTTRISSKVNGRIEKLNFKKEGDIVHVGDELYDIDSDDIAVQVNSYFSALENENKTGEKGKYDYLKEASKKNLSFWGFTSPQITRLLSSPTALPIYPVESTVDGIITRIYVKQGDYVTAGKDLFDLNDRSSVWVEVALYSDDLNEYSPHHQVDIRMENLPERQFHGKLDFVSSELQQGSKTLLARIELANKDHAIKPGMKAFVTLKSSPHQALSVPIQALVENPTGAIVWIKKEEGAFEFRKVAVGTRNEKMAEIRSGLKEGEEIVTKGSYLLNSEYILQNGKNPSDGM